MIANLNKRELFNFHAIARSCRLASIIIELIKSHDINQSRQYLHMFCYVASLPRVPLIYMYSAQEETCLLYIIDCHNSLSPIPHHMLYIQQHCIPSYVIYTYGPGSVKHSTTVASWISQGEHDN